MAATKGAEGSAERVAALRVWLTTGLGLWRRVVRTRPAVAIAIFAVALTAAVIVTSGARLLDKVSDDNIVSDITAAEPRAANLSFIADGRYGAGPEDDPLRQIAERGQRIFDDDLIEPIQDIITDQQFMIESPPFRVSSFPDQDDGPFTLSMRFRFQSELDENMTVVEGREPGERTTRRVLIGPACPPDMSAVDEFLAEQAAAEAARKEAEEAEEATAEDEDEAVPEPVRIDCRVGEIPVYEVAVTAQTASDLLVELGDTIVLRPDLTHLRWAFIRGELLDRRMLVEIVGIVELTDPTGDYWFGDDALHRPPVVENPDFRLVFASAVATPAAYRPMIRDVQDVHFDAAWRYRVDPELIDQADAADLAAEIDKLGSNDLEAVTQVPEIINQHLVERTLAVALMSTAFAGVVVVSAAAAFVLASLAADRQQSAMRLLLDRGIGRGGLRWTGLWHGLVVAIPAVVAAVALAAWLVDEARWSRPLVAGALVAAGVVGAVVTAVWLAANRAAQGTVSGPRSVPRSGTVHDLVAGDARLAGARRLVRDSALVIMAAGAVVLVRRRAEFGLGGSADVGGAGNRVGGGSLAAVAGSGADLDLLFAVAPPVLGLAAGALTIRLMVPFFRLLAAVGRRLRGAVAFVGLRRLLLQGRAARSGVVIVVLAVGMAGFASTTVAAVTESQRVNGWTMIGADVVVRGQALDAPVPNSVIEAVDAEASALVAAFQQPNTAISVPGGLPPVELLAIQTERYQALLEESPISPSLLEPLVTAAAEADGSIPAIASRDWGSAQRPAIGQRLTIRLGATRVVARVVALVNGFPTTPTGRPSVILDLEELRAAGPPGIAPTSTLFVGTDPNAGGGAEAAAALTRAIAELDPTVRVTDRFQFQADLAADPFVRWSIIGLRLLTGFAVGLAVLSVVSTLAISAPARKRDLGLLSTMGLASKQAALITAAEQLLPVVVAALAGIGVAAGLVRLIVPALNLTAFSGGPLPVEVSLVDSIAAIGAVVGPAAVVVGAVLIAVLVSTWWLVGRSRGRVGGSSELTSLSMGEV